MQKVLSCFCLAGSGTVGARPGPRLVELTSSLAPMLSPCQACSSRGGTSLYLAIGSVASSSLTCAGTACAPCSALWERATAARAIAEQTPGTRGIKNEVEHTPQICLSGSKRTKGWLAKNTWARLRMVMQQSSCSGRHLDSGPGTRRAVPWKPAHSPRDTEAEVAEPLFPSTGCAGALVIVGAQAAEGTRWKAQAVGRSTVAAPMQHLAHGDPAPAIAPARALQVGHIALNVSGARWVMLLGGRTSVA